MPPLIRPSLDRRALGLALTRIANAKATQAPADDSEPATWARRIGLTGAPGSGKSALAGRLALRRMHDRRVGVLAIDPSSRKSGGAILGDRIRMDDLAGSENLYIRSFGSRTTIDGLTDNLPELLATMDRFGFDEVIVETVGVGQAEQAVRTQVDTVILVLPPDAGDAVQAMKAGIMEIADIFAVNKSDMPSALKMATEVKRIIALTRGNGEGWFPPVLLTSQSKPESIVDLSEAVDRHETWLRGSPRHQARLLARQRYRFRRWFERRVGEIIDSEPESFFGLSHERKVAFVIEKIVGVQTHGRSTK